MKKRLLALILCLPLALSGCAAMLERGHETVTTHVEYAVTEDDSVLRAENYSGLVNAMLYFVGGHRREGTIRLYNYTGDVEADLANARNEVMYDDPLGAYSVRALSYDVTRILTYYEVELQVVYSRTAQEVQSLREVTALSGVRQELGRLVNEQRGSTVFLASYFSGDQALLKDLLDLACFSAPALYHHHSVSSKTVAFYPETGTRRVVSVKLSWGRNLDTVAREEQDYAQQLEVAAASLLEATPPSQEGYTVEELAAIVRSAAGGYDPDGSNLALDALSGQSVSDFGLLMAMEYLCQQCSIEVQPVNGSSGLWLIVAGEDGYRHLLPQGLRPPIGSTPDGELQGPEQLLYTDQELTDMGREWPNALHPACEDYGSAEPS